jgi:hypothetical protein
VDKPFPRWSGIVLIVVAFAIVALSQYACLQTTGAWCE